MDILGYKVSAKKAVPVNEKKERFHQQMWDRFLAMKQRYENECKTSVEYMRSRYKCTEVTNWWRKPGIEDRRLYNSAFFATKVDEMAAIQTDNIPSIYVSLDQMVEADKLAAASPAFRERMEDAEKAAIEAVAEDFKAQMQAAIEQAQAQGQPPPTMTPEIQAAVMQQAAAAAAEARDAVATECETEVMRTMTNLFENWQYEIKIDTFVYMMNIRARVDGWVAVRPYWDPRAKNGRGEIRLKLLGPDRLFFDHTTGDFYDSQLYDEVDYLTRGEMIKLYGEESIEDLSPDPDWSITLAQHKSGKDSAKYVVEKYLVVRRWMRDDTTVQEEIDGEEVLLRPYKNGRYIEFTEKSCLVDRAWEYEFGFPFAFFNPQADGFDAMGSPIGRRLLPIEETDNSVVQQGLENMKLFGNLTIFAEDGAFANSRNLNNEIGRVRYVEDPNGIKVVPPGNISSDVYNMHDRMGALADRISKIHAAAEGQRPASIQSGTGVVNLQEGTNRLFRPATRMYEDAFREMGRLVLGLMVKHYSKGRAYKTYMQYSKYDFGILELDLSALGVLFDVRIAPNSTLPMDRQTMANLSMTLLNARGPDGFPLVDTRFVLEKLRLDDPDLLDRMDEVKRLTQQAQEAMAQMDQMNQQVQQMAGEFESMTEAQGKLTHQNNKLSLENKAMQKLMRLMKEKYGIEKAGKHVEDLNRDVQHSIEIERLYQDLVGTGTGEGEGGETGAEQGNGQPTGRMPGM